MTAAQPASETAIAGTPVRLFVDGMLIEVPSGMSVAAALETDGRHGFSQGLNREERGLFCGMGTCHDCLVTINGKASQRACMTIATDGMHIARPSARPSLSSDELGDLAAVPNSIPVLKMDVLVIGAGPAGLAAADVAAAAGAKVTIIDERPSAGGQFFKQPATTGAADHLRRDEQALRGAELIERVRCAGATFLHNTLVWGGSHEDHGNLVLACYGPQGAFYCKPRFLVIATGAYERPPAVKGWTLPGVMTTGAAQTLIRSYGTLPGRNIVIAGNGPLNMQVATEIAKAGGHVVALAETASPPWTKPAAAAGVFLADAALAMRGLGQIASLKSRGIKLLWQTAVEAIEGDGRVEQVLLHGPDGKIVLKADTVLLGGDFTPSNELSRLLGCAHQREGDDLVVTCAADGETSHAHIHVVGEASRFGGAHIALAEGRMAGTAIATKLALNVTPDAKAATNLKRHSAFQKKLWQMFAPDTQNDVTAMADDTVVCRCEGVTYGTLKQLAKETAPDISTLKRLSRAGMGRCQGRYCGKTLAVIAGNFPGKSETQGSLAPQMPLRPVPLAALAVEKPEWGGHRRALLPTKPPLENQDPLPVTNTDTLVIGAGIAGLSTALFLAREGQQVVVVEKAFPNSLASGGNAGSLHAQLLSFDHGARAEGGGGAAAQTLPLQRDSINLWGALQKDFGHDLEMKVTGGLMVAETDAHMRFLAAKVAVEKAAGIDCEVIGQDDLRRMEPALSPLFVGAAYCPQEGKINPLVATEHVLAAAKAAGARVFDRTDVLAIEKNGTGFKVTTSRGVIQAGRIVNAAGAFASRIGAMLNLDVPVFGAPLQMVVTEAAEPTISRLVAHADRHLTLKQAANGNFIIGGGWTAGLDPVHQHPRPLFSSLEGNLWVAQHVVPALRKLHVIRSWAAMNINIDGAPILGEHPQQRGFFNAVTSNGYTLGPIVGQLTALLITGKETGRNLTPFSISRFEKGRS